MAVTEQAKPATEALAASAPDKKARISIRDLNFYYGKTHALKSINLDVPDKRVVAMIGPSGCGKSTLLRAVADLLPVSAGQLRVLGKRPAEARLAREVAFVFQDATLLPWRSVRQNVRLPLQVGRRRTRREVADRADELIALVGLAKFADRAPHQLSGGQRQRVAIARALQCEPDILLMDEPFGALDEITRERLNDELLAIWRRTGTTILFVTHSVAEAAYLGTRALVLAADPGRVRGIVGLTPIGHAQRSRDDPGLIAQSAALRRMLQGAEAA